MKLQSKKWLVGIRTKWEDNVGGNVQVLGFQEDWKEQATDKTV